MGGSDTASATVKTTAEASLQQRSAMGICEQAGLGAITLTSLAGSSLFGVG
jgi:hypothetical protein